MKNVDFTIKHQRLKVAEVLLKGGANARNGLALPMGLPLASPLDVAAVAECVLKMMDCFTFQMMNFY